MKKKWVAVSFSNETSTWWVIDDRLGDCVNKGSHTFNAGGLGGQPKLWLKDKDNYKWSPLLVLTVSERFPNEECKAYAKLICDRLNAELVAERMEI